MRRIAVLVAVAFSLLLAACTLEPEIVEVEVEKIVEVPTPAALPASCVSLVETLVTTAADLAESSRKGVRDVRTGIEQLNENARYIASAFDESVTMFRVRDTAEFAADTVHGAADVLAVMALVMTGFADIQESRHQAAIECKAELIAQGAWSEPSE